MRIFVLLCLLLPVSLFSYEIGNWKSLSRETTPDGGRIRMFQGKEIVLEILPDVKEDAGLIDVTVENGAIIIDSRAYHAKNPGKRIVLQTGMFPQSEIQPGKKAILSVEGSVSPAGEGFAFQLIGQHGNPRKQFWHAPVPVLGTEEFQTQTVTQPLADDQTHLGAFFYLRKPAVYRIRKITLTYAENDKTEAKPLPQGNQICNGGAENGLYGVFPPDMRRLGSSYDGKHKEYFDVTFSRCLTVTPDDRVARSGKYSFRLDGGDSDSSTDRLAFAHVQYFVGRPLTLSLWMKGEKPTPVDVWLHACGGCRYGVRFPITTEWRKYSITIPEWGKPAGKNIDMVGNPAVPFGDAAPGGYFTPNVLIPRPNQRIWIDDIRCEYALSTSDESVLSPAQMIGTQEKSFVRAGERIETGLSIESAGTASSGTLSWKLTDVFGKIILEGAPQKIDLPFKADFAVPPPENRRGPMTLSFELVLPDGSRCSRNFLTGVTGPEKPLDPALGANVPLSERHNAELLSRLLREFRIGSVRMWRDGYFNRPEADASKIYHKNGFYVLYCLSSAYGKGMRFLLPADPSEYLANLEKFVIAQTRGNVDAYEIFNEPNAWHVSENPDPAKYIPPTQQNVMNMTRKIRDVLKKCDPDAKIAGPATCHTDVSWIQSWLEAGGRDFADILTEHPYRYFPEMPDYAEDLSVIQTLGKHFGKKMPVFSTESGSVIPTALPENTLVPRLADTAANDQRLAILAFVGGAEKYFHFQSGIGIPQMEFSDVIFHDTATDFGGWTPAPSLYALRALADILENAKFIRQVRIGIEARCYIFDRGDRRIAALWKWTGNPGSIRFPAPVDYYDFVGSKFHGNVLPFDPHPVFIESALTADALETLIRNAKIPTGGAGCSVTASAAGRNRASVTVKNLTASPISGTLDILKPVSKRFEFKGIPAEQSVSFPIELPEEVSITPQTITTEITTAGAPVLKSELEIKGLLVPCNQGKIVIDGDLSDWKNPVTAKLDFRNAVAFGKMPWTDTEKKINADLNMLWDKEFLYMSVIVHKDGYFPAMIPWNGDSVQIAFDPVRNAEKTTIGYQADDFEYAVSQQKDQPSVLRVHASAASYDSLVKKVGVIDEVSAAVRHEDGKTVYEMAFPKPSVSPFALKAGSAMGFSVLVNVSDGKERRGWLELTPGIGERKEPGKFTVLILQP